MKTHLFFFTDYRPQFQKEENGKDCIAVMKCNGDSIVRKNNYCETNFNVKCGNNLRHYAENTNILKAHRQNNTITLARK